MTQKELADEISVKRERYARWEEGLVKSIPSEFLNAIQALQERNGETDGFTKLRASKDQLHILISILNDRSQADDIRGRAFNEMRRLIDEGTPGGNGS